MKQTIVAMAVILLMLAASSNAPDLIFDLIWRAFS
jgi:hypothetical protein